MSDTNNINQNQQQTASGPAVNYAKPAPSPEEILFNQNLKADRFSAITLGCLLYAILYTFCVYKCPVGITMPILALGTDIGFSIFAKRFGYKLSARHYLVMLAILLLGTVICTTMSTPIIVLSKVWSVFLLLYLILSTVCDDKGWTVGDYFSSMIIVIFSTIEKFFTYFGDASAFKKRKVSSTVKEADMEAYNAKKAKTKSIFLGILIAVPFLLVIISLLASADVLFSNIFNVIGDWFKNLNPDFDFSNIFGIAFTFVLAFLATYGLITFLNGNKKNLPPNTNKKVFEDTIIATTTTSLVTVVYVVFALIQIFGLFLGFMSLPEGYTYAEYAREGFFQLLFVSLINILYILFVSGKFKESKVLKILLLVVSLCTFIIIASSAYRMILYIKFYHLTFLRVFVLWSLLVTAIVMLGVSVCIFKKDFPFFRYTLSVISVLFIALAFSHPDYWIAKYDVNEILNGSASAYHYLTENLSCDAAPVILENNAKLNDYEINSYDPYFRAGQHFFDDNLERGIRNYNFSYRAWSKTVSNADKEKF